MTEFTTWRSLVDGERISATPDTVTSRPDDDGDSSLDVKNGVQITTKTSWASFGAEISNRTEDATRAYIYSTDENGDADEELASTDISDKSAGDAFAFDDVNLDANEKYVIALDAEGSGWRRGIAVGEDNYPYEGDDVDFSGAVGAFPETADDIGVRVVNNIGNPQGILD